MRFAAKELGVELPASGLSRIVVEDLGVLAPAQRDWDFTDDKFDPVPAGQGVLITPGHRLVGWPRFPRSHRRWNTFLWANCAGKLVEDRSDDVLRHLADALERDAPEDRLRANGLRRRVWVGGS